jgi:hypothetical protein
MRYRVLTAGAVLLTWLVIYLLDFTKSPIAFLIPLAVLAFFQMGEKRLSKYLNHK